MEHSSPNFWEPVPSTGHLRVGCESHLWARRASEAPEGILLHVVPVLLRVPQRRAQSNDQRRARELSPGGKERSLSFAARRPARFD